MRTPPWIGLVGAGLFGALAAWWWAREPAPPPIPLPEHAAPGLAQVDLARVHRELLVAGISGPEHPALAAAVAPDPTLRAAVAALAARSADPEAVARVWNAYLRDADAPWRIEVQWDAPVDIPGALRAVEVGTYEVVGVGGAQVDEVDVRAELWHRVASAVPERGWLGVTRPDGPPTLLLEPIVTFALDQIWPMLDAELDPELDRMRRAFAPEVRREVAAILSAEELGVLAETAEDRFWMVRSAEEIARRRSCGSTFGVARLPWDGLDARDLEAVRQASGRGEPGCPEVTETEALVLAVRSGQVRHAQGLRPALEHLAGVIGRVILVHEARHVYDQRATEPVTCAGCDLHGTDAAEAVAYLTTWRDPATSAVAAYQACATAVEYDGERSVAALSAALGDLCARGPAPDLAERADALFGAWFGRAPRVSVPEPFVRLPVGGPS